MLGVLSMMQSQLGTFGDPSPVPLGATAGRGLPPLDRIFGDPVRDRMPSRETL